MADPVVYRSTNAAVLAHWEAATGAEAQQAWRDRVDAALAELGFAGRRAIVATYLSGTEVTGVEHPASEPIPLGWRPYPGVGATARSAIRPKRSTKDGKAAAETLAALTRPNPRAGMPGGMPHVASSAVGMAFMRAAMQLMDGALYVRWPEEPADVDLRRIDTKVWERVRLSEYYAAREKADADQVEVGR